MVGHFSNSWAMCTKRMHHGEILIGHFREMVRNWPVASCYFALCVSHAVWSGTTECVKGKHGT